VDHLKEEEKETLPLLRKHFEFKTWKPVEEEIVAHSPPRTIGCILHAMSEAEAESWARLVGIPDPVIESVFMPARKAYVEDLSRLLQDIRAGKEPAVLV